MNVRTILFLWVFLQYAFQSVYSRPLAEEFKQVGYLEICDVNHGMASYHALYAYFDELTEFLKQNPFLKKKLYEAKERFIRSQHKTYYSTDFFGLYDESEKKERCQVSFYYSVHYHEFIYLHYPEISHIPEINQFLEVCRKIQQPCAQLFDKAARDLNVKTIFDSKFGQPPILLKIVKYLPSYIATRPHYDGTAFSLFLDSTDNQSLLLSPYKSSFSIDDFCAPQRKFMRSYDQNSILLIPGALLAEYSIYPTPHIVVQSGNIRYATVAFAMRPNYSSSKKFDYSPLPNFRTCLHSSNG